MDRAQLTDMQRYLSHLASAHHTFKLLSNVDRACRVFPAPPDREMLENFDQHRALFKAIAEMAQSDHDLRRIDEAAGFPDDSKAQGVSQVRAQEYRELFDQAVVPRGIIGQGRGQFELIYWSYGAVPTDGFEKSYVHLQKPPKGLRKTTDGYEWEPRRRFEVYRHIEGDWYLYLSHTPG